MEDKLILKKAAVRIVPFVLGMYLGRNMAQSFQDMPGVDGGPSQVILLTAIFAFITGMGIVVWAIYKEFKMPMILSFVLMTCGVTMTAFGLWTIL